MLGRYGCAAHAFASHLLRGGRISSGRLRSSRRSQVRSKRCALLFPGPPRELFGARLPSSAARGFSREHLGQRARMFFPSTSLSSGFPAGVEARASPRGNSRPRCSSRVCGGWRQGVPRSSGTLDKMRILIKITLQAPSSVSDKILLGSLRVSGSAV